MKKYLIYIILINTIYEMIYIILIHTIYDMIYYIYYVRNTTFYKFKYYDTISDIIIINSHSLIFFNEYNIAIIHKNIKK